MIYRLELEWDLDESFGRFCRFCRACRVRGSGGSGGSGGGVLFLIFDRVSCRLVTSFKREIVSLPPPALVLEKNRLTLVDFLVDRRRESEREWGI